MFTELPDVVKDVRIGNWTHLVERVQDPSNRSYLVAVAMCADLIVVFSGYQFLKLCQSHPPPLFSYGLTCYQRKHVTDKTTSRHRHRRTDTHTRTPTTHTHIVSAPKYRGLTAFLCA